MAQPDWDSVAPEYVRQHYGSAYGQVRTHVVHAQLLRHLPRPPARIVDVGGGAGHQAVPLAREGYDVVVLDPSSRMLAEAEKLRSLEPQDVAARLSLLQGVGEAAPSLLHGSFHGVLCHGVLMYLDDPAPLLDALVQLLAPEGYLSIVAKNRNSLAMRPGIDRDWEGVLTALGATAQPNGFGVDTRADDIDELTLELARRGVCRAAWYGVRLFVESWGRDEPPVPQDDRLLDAELEVSLRDPYRQLSRLFHFVGRRQFS